MAKKYKRYNETMNEVLDAQLREFKDLTYEARLAAAREALELRIERKTPEAKAANAERKQKKKRKNDIRLASARDRQGDVRLGRQF